MGERCVTASGMDGSASQHANCTSEFLQKRLKQSFMQPLGSGQSSRRFFGICLSWSPAVHGSKKDVVQKAHAGDSNLPAQIESELFQAALVMKKKVKRRRVQRKRLLLKSVIGVA